MDVNDVLMDGGIGQSDRDWNMELKFTCTYVVLFVVLQYCCARIHKLEIKVCCSLFTNYVPLNMYSVIRRLASTCVLCIARLNLVNANVLLLSKHLTQFSLWLQNDDRKYIALSTFGFYKDGLLKVNLTNFHSYPFSKSDVVSHIVYLYIQIRNSVISDTIVYM
jgi:hypothetical protein